MSFKQGFVLVVTLLCMIDRGCSDFAADQAECTDSLLGLMTCLPYVQSEAKSPTPDCCTGYKEVTSKSVKCVCVLIKDRNEPGLGITVNVSRAIQLPSQCHQPFNASTCISLLKLPKDSKYAKEFEQFEGILEGRHNKVSTKDTGASGTTAAAAATAAPHVNGGLRERFTSVEMLAAVWTWSLAIAWFLAFGGYI